MTTIVEPKQHIDQLWGKQRIREDITYRLMKYVLRVDHDGKVLLHNVVTGQLVVLDQGEAEALEKMPMTYVPVIEQLVTEHYLVPEDYDEHQQVVNLRHILHRFYAMDVSHGDGIRSYTILPTTACNARCYYCFEHDVRPVTMTEQIADDTVKFITDHCGDEKNVSIRWFGGEPTVAVHRIDQICEGLRKNGIKYSSRMTTNGYLFDEEMVAKAKTLWNLTFVMISVDGTERNYNEIKAYVNVTDNPYQRVLRNIGLLLDQGIRVSLRMNFDIGNWQDFEELLKEAGKRFQRKERLHVFAFPVEGAYPQKNGNVLHGSEDWLCEKLAELNEKARETGLFQRKKELPSLFFGSCQAGSSSSMVITSEGKLGRCTAMFNEEDQIVGNVTDGIAIPDYYKAYTRFGEPDRCKNCVLLPDCILIEKCPGPNRCFFTEWHQQYDGQIKRVFNAWTGNRHNERRDEA